MRTNRKNVVIIIAVAVVVIILLRIISNSHLSVTTGVSKTEMPFVTTNTPKPTATNTPSLTATSTPKPTATNIPSPTVINTPVPTVIPVLSDEPDLLENLNGKRVLFSTEDAQTFTFSVRDYEAYKTGTVGDYYIEYGCVDTEILAVSVEEKVRYIYTNFPHLEDNNWHYFNSAGYSLTVKPLKEGTTQVYFHLYEDENCTKLYDKLTFTVEVEFIKESDFSEGEYNPIASGYPYKEYEWQYGDDIVVSVWASNDRKRAVLVVKGTGEMWDFNTALKNIKIASPWGNSESCKYVQTIYELHISEGITYIEEFSSLPRLEIVTFPSTLKTIGDFAFKNTNFKELIFPEGLEVIGKRAFLWCYSLENIKLPSTLKYIGPNAFGLEAGSKERSRNILKEIVIPESVEFIGCYAFGYRYDTNIILPEGLDTSGFEKDWDLIAW